MHIQDADRRVLQADGVVRRVDPIGRELEILMAGAPVSFDVRPGCVTTLRGERVKLRLVQPRDRVRITYAEFRGLRVAGAVDVQSGGLAAS